MQASDVRATQKMRVQQIRYALAACDLRQIPAISVLRIEAHDFNLRRILSYIPYFPTGTLECLDLNGDTTPSATAELWPWTAFLESFPPFSELIVRKVSAFALDGGSPLLGIKRLILQEHTTCAFPDLLLAVPNLEYLHIGPVYDQDDHDMTPGVDYSLSKLQTLSMDQLFSFPWGVRFTAPNLTSYRFTTDEGCLDDEFCAFLTACKSLHFVELGMMDDSIMPLARATSTIQHLTLILDESKLPSIHWNNPDAIPFPQLKTLTLISRSSPPQDYYKYIDSDEEEDIDMDETNPDTASTGNAKVLPNQFLDYLVMTRCLPRSHEASLLPETLLALEALKITVSSPDIPSDWMKSIHLHSATAKVTENTFSDTSITLSWIHEEAGLLGIIPESPFHEPL
ncbi:hypothetical protein M408DRAFT_331029 [Serendipita vermifera MAFF 305830]|uniref:F-box domain-containing protein n=1 Tax=Serendipita vermifera MAFF 305830 TaxID=933852 RepID=A0A0C3B0D7_SERVB|nr:hypothetical protein M408DRAFT_331029 [Serendipita vermifera MAFF 305830]